GDTLLYSTYIGGNSDDGGYSIAIDSNNNVYVTGHTFSLDFPLVNEYQSTNGGGYDAFILKLNPAGDTLLYSTYIGGSGWDRCEGIVVDSNGNAYVAGRTTSIDFPLANDYQSANGGLSDAYVLKFGYSTVPSAPQNLQAVAGNAQVALTWQAPISNGGWDIANYTVYRGTTSGGETLLTTLPNVLTYTDVGLINGQTYYYKVSAVNWAGEGPKSNESSATPVTTPSSPQNLQAEAGDTQVTLTWQVPISNGGAAITGYSVYRGTVSGGETLLITLGNVLTHLDTGLTNGQIYYYKATATNSVGEGAQSIEVSATPATLPTAPQNLQASAGDTQITLTWLEPLSNGGLAVTNYRIYRGTTSGGEVLLTTIGNVLTYVDTGLTNGQTYYYVVSATNSVGEGPQTSEISSVPVGPPSAPQNLRVTSGNTQAMLSWSAPLTNGGLPVTTYKIYRGTVSGVELYLTDVGTVLTYTDTGLTNGITYYYKVSAANSLGEGPQSSEASATPRTIPTAPQNLQSQAGDSYVLLAWIAPSSDGGSEITNYKVYKGTSSASLSLLTTLGNVLIYNDTEVTNGVTYYYEVGATNALGDGPRSDQLSATPQTGLVHTVPSAPQNLQAFPGDAQVMLVWASPSDNGGLIITSYRIYRGTSAGATSYLATVGNVLSFTDHIVSNGITYHYRVGAVNDVGEGVSSDEVSATPSSAISPSAPQNVLAEAGDSYVLLTWNAPLSNGSSAVTNYIVYRGTDSTSLSLLITIGDALSYNDTSVVNGQTYYYMISAVNSVGEGNPSETVSATPTAPRGSSGDNSMLIIAAVVILALIAIIIVAKMRKRK
ncbi:MAG: fibronectin type III domain-containing protein, partial [Methanomassiliicoccales archaeon]|nr:fibronectin type III domain-containing protein [Methanomassiliicoccales archaeon]